MGVRWAGGGVVVGGEVGGADEKEMRDDNVEFRGSYRDGWRIHWNISGGRRLAWQGILRSLGHAVKGGRPNMQCLK